MFKFLAVLCTMSILGSLYAIYEVNTMSNYQAFTPENVERVRNGTPQEYTPSPVYMDSIYKEIDCLQQNIFFEARNQNELARVAVGWVTLNRVKGKRYPNSICKAVWQNRQFSWTHDGKSDKPNLRNRLEREAWEESGIIAEHMVKHCLIEPDVSCPPDPTNGAQYYFNPKLASPKWSKRKVKTSTVGDHDFYVTSIASAD